MTFPEALARSRAAYAMGLDGGECEAGHNQHTLRDRGPWWEASERLGLYHRLKAREAVLEAASPQGDPL